MPRFLKETCRYGNGGIRKNRDEKGEKIYMQQNRETEKQTGSAKETGKKIRAYLDNSSTTQPCREAVEAAVRSMEDNWGNPSSLHTLGFLAEQEMRKSRETGSAQSSRRHTERAWIRARVPALPAPEGDDAAEGKRVPSARDAPVKTGALRAERTGEGQKDNPIGFCGVSRGARRRQKGGCALSAAESGQGLFCAWNVPEYWQLLPQRQKRCRRRDP